MSHLGEINNLDRDPVLGTQMLMGQRNGSPAMAHALNAKCCDVQERIAHLSGSAYEGSTEETTSQLKFEE